MLRKLGILTGLTVIGTAGLVATDNTPSGLFSIYKIANTAIAGSKMAKVYKSARHITPETS